MKNSVPKTDKKRRKLIQADIDVLEKNLKARHEREVGNIQGNEEIHDWLENIKIKDTEEEIRPEVRGANETQSNVQKTTKAQKRRDKKSQIEKDRQERIANEDVSDLAKPREMENLSFRKILQEKHLEIFEVPSDGDCMYKSISHQLSLHGVSETVKDLRTKTADYIRNHRNDFIHFLVSDLTGDMMNDKEFETYCDSIQNTKAWGGQIELEALVQVLGIRIDVYQATGPVLNLGKETDDKKLIIR